MGRPKGSLNKNIKHAKSEIEEKININIVREGMTVAQKTVEYDIELINKELDLARVELENAKREIEAKKQELKMMPISVEKEKSATISVKNEALKQKIEAQKAIDSQMVNGKFYNLRAKGQPAKLTYMRYADDPVKWYTFNHGEVYTIPRGFADEINEHYHTPHFIKNESPIIDPSNPDSGIHGVDKSDKMYSFVPLRF